MWHTILKMILQSTLIISTSDMSTLRICRRICNVPNSIPIHSIYIYSVYVNICKSTLRLPWHFFRSQTMFSRLNLIVYLDNPCNTQCKLWKSLFITWPNLTPVNLSWGGVNRSLDMQGLCNRRACVIKSWLSHTCLLHF